MKNKFNIGDTIIITNGGQHYPSYEGMSVILKATKWKSDEFGGIGHVLDNKKGVIKNFHIKDSRIYYLIDLGETEIIIDESGIKLINKINKNTKVYGIAKFCKEYYK